MSNYNEVRERLGEDSVNLILDYVRHGKIGEQKMADIALTLSQTVYGNHIKRKEQERYRETDVEMRSILSDWWNEELFDMTRAAAHNKLTKVFSNNDINLKPLAMELNKMLEKAEPTAQLEKKCNPCKEDGLEKQAMIHCDNCEEYFCSECNQHHSKFRATRSHRVRLLTRSQVAEGNSFGDDLTTYWETREEKPEDMK